MEFWGAEVQGGEPLIVKPDYDCLIHLSQASLDNGKKGEPVLLNVTLGGKKYVMGTLSEENIPQISFNLSFAKEFELSHSSQGSVHFIGYKSPNGDEKEKRIDVDEKDESDDEEEEKEIETHKKMDVDEKHESDDEEEEKRKKMDVDEEHESDDEEEVTLKKPEPSNKKRPNESATPFSAKKAKPAEASTPQKTGESVVFEMAQRLNDLVEPHDPVTKTYLNTFSKEVSYPVHFPSYLVENNIPQSDELFLSSTQIAIEGINMEATEDDVVKFLEDNNFTCRDVKLFEEEEKNMQEAGVEFAEDTSREDLQKLMNLPGGKRRIYQRANGKYSKVSFSRMKNSLRVFYISGYDDTLSEKEVIQQVEKAFRSSKSDAATVKKVIVPKHITGELHGFCYLILDNVTPSSEADALAVTRVGNRSIEIEVCQPRRGVFGPYLNE